MLCILQSIDQYKLYENLDWNEYKYVLQWPQARVRIVFDNLFIQIGQSSFFGEERYCEGHRVLISFLLMRMNHL